VMDAILDQSLATILEELPIRHEIKDALLARTGLHWNLLEIATAHERADWQAISALAVTLGIKEDQIPEIYVSAVDWASALRRDASVFVP
jgi:c-di-GMP phosphodiesterase